MPTPLRRDTRVFLALVFVLTFAVRLCIACSRCDEAELELYSGTFGWALLRDMPLDPARLPIIDHLRGSVLFGALAAPLYALFGPQLLALKLLSCTWAAAHALLFAWLVDRALGRFAALVAALLLAFAPPSYQMVSVLALGSHEAVGLWIALALLVLIGPGARVDAADGLGACAGLDPRGAATDAKHGAHSFARLVREPRSAARVAAFGACCGFGVLFSYQFAVALPGLALAWFALDPRFPLRARSWVFVLAAAPLLACIRVLSTQGKLVATKFSDHFEGAEAGTIASKLGELVTYGVRRSWLFEEQGGAAWSWVVLACLALGLVATLRRARKLDALALYALAHPVCYCVSQAITDFELNFDNTLDGIGSRYLMPIWPCFALWIAYAVRDLRANASPLARIASWTLGAAPLAAGLAGCLALFGPSQAWRAPPMRGIDVAGFGFHLRHASGGDQTKLLEWTFALDPDWRALRPLALEAERLDTPYSEAELQRRLDNAHWLEGSARQCRLVSIGEWLARPPEPQRFAAPALAALPPDERAWLMRGVGRELMLRSAIDWLRKIRTPDNFANRMKFVPQSDRAAVIEGAGCVAGFRVTPYNPPGLDLFRQGLMIGPKHRPRFYRCAGLAFRTRYFEHGYFVPREGVLRVERELPADALQWFREGLRMPQSDTFDADREPTLAVRE